MQIPISQELNNYGFNCFADSVSKTSILDTTNLGRVIRIERDWDIVRVTGDTVACQRQLGEFDRNSEPCVGDWVVVNKTSQDEETTHYIHQLLPSKNRIVRRRSSSGKPRPQVLATNVDFGCIISGLDTPLNQGRLIRTLVMLKDADVQPILALTKKDLASPNDLEVALTTAREVDPHMEVVAVNSLTGEGIDNLDGLIDSPGKTTIMIGASGAGKSTLINKLLGQELQKTASVREKDKRGKHTTTFKDLISAPKGYVVIDTPGVRSLGLWEAEYGLAKHFAEIDALASQCRFAGCAHRDEPDCAVTKAVAASQIPNERLDLFHKLSDEIKANRVEDRGH